MELQLVFKCTNGKKRILIVNDPREDSLVQSAIRQSLLAPFFTASKRYTIIAFFPLCGALALFALRQSGFVANGTRRLTFFATPSTADNGTAVRAVIGRVRNRRLCQLPDLYASATPHSLRSYGVCSVARSLSRYRFVANSFRQAAPKPTYAPTAFVLSSARSVLRTSIADNNTSIGCIDYSRCAVRRGTNSIPPMTAAAALLSSFVRAVLTWRHRTVTSNCKQHDDTSSAVSPLIA